MTGPTGLAVDPVDSHLILSLSRDGIRPALWLGCSTDARWSEQKNLSRLFLVTPDMLFNQGENRLSLLHSCVRSCTEKLTKEQRQFDVLI